MKPKHIRYKQPRIAATKYFLQVQDGLCAICLFEIQNDDDGYGLDHDHACCPRGISVKCLRSPGYGCARGVLCRKCNIGLGYFDDDLAKLRAAIEYLS